MSDYFWAAHLNGENIGPKVSFQVESIEYFVRHKSSNEWPTALKFGVA